MRQAKTVEIPEDRTITEEEYRKLSSHAYKSSVWYITTYNKNSYQTREKLLKKGYIKDSVIVLKNDSTQYEVNIIDEIIEKLFDYYILDDDAYVDSFIRNSLSRGIGLSSIRVKLLNNGIPQDMIERFFVDYENDTRVDEALDKSAYKIINSSSFRKLDFFKRKEKIVRSLVSKGFALSDIFEWVEEHHGDISDEERTI